MKTLDSFLGGKILLNQDQKGLRATSDAVLLAAAVPVKKNETLLDAYAGVCTIGLLASKYVKEVTSVEIVKSAVLNGKNNAKLNNINNIKIIEADCTEYINNELPHFDVVIMDPPRKGSTVEFLNALLKIKQHILLCCLIFSYTAW